MLKNIDPVLSPELLSTLRAMGHGDELAIVDANYPAEASGRTVIRMDGVTIATRVLEAVLSLMPLDEFVRTRITDPLGMRDTKFFLPAGQRDRLAAVYGSASDGRIVRSPEGPKGQGHYVEGPRRSFAGGAGLLSTARDYGRFLEMIRNGGTLGGVRILAPRTVALMSSNQVASLHSSNGLGFGLGFETTDRVGANGLEPKGAYGWAGAYGTIYRIEPEARLVHLLMIQLMPNATDLREKFPTLVYQALVERSTRTTETSQR